MAGIRRSTLEFLRNFTWNIVKLAVSVSVKSRRSQCCNATDPQHPSIKKIAPAVTIGEARARL